MIGRVEELQLLENLYAENSLRIINLHGPSGIGKTKLVTEFAQNKRKVYFSVRDALQIYNKQIFITEVARYLGDVRRDIAFEVAIENLMKKATGEKLILIIDEAQNLQSGFPDFLCCLQCFLQQYREKLRLLIIFSSRRKVDLRMFYGAKNFITKSICIDLHPLTYIEAMKYYEVFSNEDKVLLYGVTGGYPNRLQLLDQTISAKENLYKLFFAVDSLMNRLTANLLIEKFRTKTVYETILYALASGNNRISTIAKEIGIECNKLSKYMNVLCEQGLLERIIPANEATVKKKHKKSFYKFKDSTLLFWYCFVYPYQEIIKTRGGNQLLRQKILNNIHGYCQSVFFDICLQHCAKLKANSDFPIVYRSIGYMWAEAARNDELYLLATSSNNACIALCLWEKNRYTKDDITYLQDLRKNLGYEKAPIIVFSRKGFTDRDLQLLRQLHNIRFISLFYIN